MWYPGQMGFLNTPMTLFWISNFRLLYAWKVPQKSFVACSFMEDSSCGLLWLDKVIVDLNYNPVSRQQRYQNTHWNFLDNNILVGQSVWVHELDYDCVFSCHNAPEQFFCGNWPSLQFKMKHYATVHCSEPWFQKWLKSESMDLSLKKTCETKQSKLNPEI